MAILSRDAHAPAELVVHEVRDFAHAVAMETALTIVLGGQQRLLAGRDQNVSLAGCIADEQVALPRDPDDVIWTTVEAVLAGVFVQQPAPYALDKLGRGLMSNEVAAY